LNHIVNRSGNATLPGEGGGRARLEIAFGIAEQTQKQKKKEMGKVWHVNAAGRRRAKMREKHKKMREKETTRVNRERDGEETLALREVTVSREKKEIRRRKGGKGEK